MAADLLGNFPGSCGVSYSERGHRSLAVHTLVFGGVWGTQMLREKKKKQKEKRKPPHGPPRTSSPRATGPITSANMRIYCGTISVGQWCEYK